MSRSKAGSEGGAILVVVLFGPYALGYYFPWFALALLVLVVLVVWRLFVQASSGESPSWVVRHPILSLLGVVWLGGGIGWGMLNQHTDVTKAARLVAEDREREREREASIAREAAERRAREAAEQQRAEAERLAEARRTPSERAAIAQQLLGDLTSDLHEHVCTARRTLAPVPAEARRNPEVRAALRRLRYAERIDLREARAAAASGRMIMCCDGTLSPSCECGRSNRRGCCSWHHGICGCEPLPDEVVCP